MHTFRKVGLDALLTPENCAERTKIYIENPKEYGGKTYRQVRMEVKKSKSGGVWILIS